MSQIVAVQLLPSVAACAVQFLTAVGAVITGGGQVIVVHPFAADAAAGLQFDTAVVFVLVSHVVVIQLLLALGTVG